MNTVMLKRVRRAYPSHCALANVVRHNPQGMGAQHPIPMAKNGYSPTNTKAGETA